MTTLTRTVSRVERLREELLGVSSGAAQLSLVVAESREFHEVNLERISEAASALERQAAQARDLKDMAEGRRIIEAAHDEYHRRIAEAVQAVKGSSAALAFSVPNPGHLATRILRSLDRATQRFHSRFRHPLVALTDEQVIYAFDRDPCRQAAEGSELSRIMEELRTCADEPLDQTQEENAGSVTLPDLVKEYHLDEADENALDAVLKRYRKYHLNGEWHEVDPSYRSNDNRARYTYRRKPLQPALDRFRKRRARKRAQG